MVWGKKFGAILTEIYIKIKTKFATCTQCIVTTCTSVRSAEQKRVIFKFNIAISPVVSPVASPAG